MITKKELEHLGELTRLDLGGIDEEKLLKDLQGILDHFEELKNIKTDKVEPVTGLRLAEAGFSHAKAGGTFAENVFRADDSRETELPGERSVEQFPEKEKGFLKIPPVFE